MTRNNLSISKKSITILLTAALLVGGFFVFKTALANHVYTAIVSPSRVAGNSVNDFVFTLTHSDGDGIIKITIQSSDFQNFSNLICPPGWVSGYELDSVECRMDTGEAIKLGSGEVRFQATAPDPLADTSYQWNVFTDDNGGGALIPPQSAPQTVVDVTRPTFVSARFLTGTNLEITFSEPLLEADWTKFTSSEGYFTATGASVDSSIVNVTIVDLNNPAAETNDLDIALGAVTDIVGNPNEASENNGVTDGQIPFVISATATPDPAKDGLVTVTVAFDEEMDVNISPTVQVTNITGSPITVVQSSYAVGTWTGTFTLADNNEEAVATIAVSGAKDMNGNEMVVDDDAGTFVVDTRSPEIVTYTIDNVAISPEASPGINDAAIIDLRFSEEVEANLDILNAGGEVVNDLYDSNGVTNPLPKTWDGKDNSDNFVAEGVYTIQIIITDEAGNSLTDTTRTIVVDNTSPVAVEVVPVVTFIRDTTPDLTINVEDGVLWEIKNGDVVLMNGTGTGLDEIVTFPELTEGAYALVLKATDAAGNFTEVDLSDFTVDVTAPVLTLVGDAVIDLTIGSAFTDPGVTATDNFDSNPAITAIDTVNTAVSDTYINTYTATDLAGNAATITRTINVIVPPPQVVVSGGGGGGGGGYVPPAPPTPLIPPQVLGVATFNFTSDLGIGMSGEAVTELQNRLTSEGVYSGSITGYFGPLTLAGVRAYQAKYGISQTGFVGPFTRAKLNNGQVAGAASVATEVLRTQIAALQAQLVALLEQLAQILQSQAAGAR